MLEDSSRNWDFGRLIIEEKYQILDSALIKCLNLPLDIHVIRVLTLSLHPSLAVPKLTESFNKSFALHRFKAEKK